MKKAVWTIERTLERRVRNGIRDRDKPPEGWREEYVPDNGAQSSAAGQRATLVLPAGVVAIIDTEVVDGQPSRSGAGGPGPGRQPEDQGEEVGDEDDEAVEEGGSPGLDEQDTTVDDEGLDGHEDEQTTGTGSIITNERAEERDGVGGQGEDDKREDEDGDLDVEQEHGLGLGDTPL